MAAVSLKLLQSGSGTTALHCQPADVVTIQLAETVESPALDEAVAACDGLTNVTGVVFAFSNAGGAGQKVAFAQTGSASATINAQAADTVTISLAETVESPVLDEAVATLNSCLFPISGVTIAFDNGGGAT